MRLKILSEKVFENLKPYAKMILAYGDQSAGKTFNSIQTLIESFGELLIIKCEGRSLSETIKLTGVNPSMITIYEYTKWDDLIDFLGNPTEEEQQVLANVKAVLIDNVSHLMNNELKWEIEDDTYRRVYKDSKNDGFVNENRMGMDGYGAVESKMSRFFKLVTTAFIRQGKPVVFTALLKSSPSYDRALVAGPNFIGKALPENLKSFFDLIGRVVKRYNSEEDKQQLIYPPGIEFDSPDGSFMAKWTGNPEAPKRRILDWGDILKGTKETNWKMGNNSQPTK